MTQIERVEILMVDLKPKVLRTDAIQSFVSQETPILRITDSDGATAQQPDNDGGACHCYARINLKDCAATTIFIRNWPPHAQWVFCNCRIRWAVRKRRFLFRS